MSTRGAWGFHANGIDTVAYNHFDSYPSGLGAEIVDMIRNYDNGVLRYAIGHPSGQSLMNDAEPWGANDFLLDSLFCEYAYIMNLDTYVLEVYQGFNTDGFGEGRYATVQGKADYRGINQYYGVRLPGEIPFRELRGVDQLQAHLMVEALDPPEEEE